MSSFFLPDFGFQCDDSHNGKNTVSAIANCKKIRERWTEERREYGRQLEDDLETLITLMKRYRKSKSLNRIACHIISNMAIDQNKCDLVCKCSGHIAILRAVRDHTCDWKVCWLGMSAIWNLARPITCRSKFTSDTLKLIYKVLAAHRGVHLVIETALGALSNLVLFDHHRTLAGKFRNLAFILEVIKESIPKINVSTAASGLITNLGHSNEIANRLVLGGAVGLTVQMMEVHSHDTHLNRNCCAALSNLSSSNHFTQELIEQLGIESLFRSLNLAALNPSANIEPLAEQALFCVDVDWTKSRMSSLHLAAQKGMMNSVFKTLLMMKVSPQSMDINVVDSHGMNALHHSVMGSHDNVTKLLVSRGCDPTRRNGAGKSPMDLIKHNNQKMHIAFECGKRQLKCAKAAMNKMLCRVCCYPNDIDDEESRHNNGEDAFALPKEIGMIIVEFIDAFEIMNQYGNDEFSRKALVNTSPRLRLPPTDVQITKSDHR